MSFKVKSSIGILEKARDLGGGGGGVDEKMVIHAAETGVIYHNFENANGKLCSIIL